MTLNSSRLLSSDALLVHAGSSPADRKGAVNPPARHGSTVLFAPVAALEADPAGLIADLQRGFARLRAAGGGPA